MAGLARRHAILTHRCSHVKNDAFLMSIDNQQALVYKLYTTDNPLDMQVDQV
jgi:hypothetical protein